MFCNVTLKRVRICQPDEVAGCQLLKIDLAAAGKLSAPRRHQYQPILAEPESFHIIRQGMLGRKAEIRGTDGDRRGNIGAFALLDIDVDIGMFAQKRRQRFRQMFGQARGIGEQMHTGSHPACVGREIAAHRIDIVDDDAGMIEQAFACRGQLDATTAAPQEHGAERLFQAFDPRACRGQREVGAHRTTRDATLVRNRDKQMEVDQVETHGLLTSCLPSS